MTEHALIVGGGLAGLSAAVALADRGLRVTLLESRPRLGGRAGSFQDHASGEWIDTCQHVSMGCCTNLRHLCRTVGIDDLFREERELTFIGPVGERCRFRDNPGPAPLHLARALFGLKYLTLSEKLRLGLDLRELARQRWAAADDLSFADWLQQEARTPDARDRFWDVILVSALSETAERVSVSAARKVFVDGFLSHRNGWRVFVPTAPLNELYGTRLTGWLQSRGAAVHTQAGVSQLLESGERVTAAQLRDGTTVEADEFIIAIPWHRLAELVPPSLKDHPAITAASRLDSAPISSVHLWFDRPVLDVPHAVLVGRLSQWVFARADGAGGGGTGYLQVVISASRHVTELSSDEVIRTVVGELAAIWPMVSTATLLRARVVTEHRAVFSPLPGAEQKRPPQQSPIGNLQFAGDWTKTGWPATMEGAVRSGFQAAENVLRRLGRRESLVQPGLPTGRLSRWLLS